MAIKIINKINIRRFLLIFILGIFIFGGVFAAQAQSTSAVITGTSKNAVQSPNETDKVASTKTQITQLKEVSGNGSTIAWMASRILFYASAGVDFAIALGDGLVGMKAVQTGW